MKCTAFFSWNFSPTQASSAAQGAWFVHAFTCSGKLCFINVCDCTDARATVLMADNCLNEIFVRNTVIPGGMKAVPTTAGGGTALWLTSGRNSS